VEKQMPQKYEHVLKCHLSQRQRLLYDEFMSRTKTKETLAAGNYLSIINILMQLRKVCNHPNLFLEPDVASPLRAQPLQFEIPTCVVRHFESNPTLCLHQGDTVGPDRVNFAFLQLCLLHAEITDDGSQGACVLDDLSSLERRIVSLPLPVGIEAYSPAAPSPRFASFFVLSSNEFPSDRILCLSNTMRACKDCSVRSLKTSPVLTLCGWNRGQFTARLSVTL
jgi:hypothetical protein